MPRGASPTRESVVTFTAEQFQAFMDTTMAAYARIQPTVSPGPVQQGNFVRCTARFSGANDTNVEAFIDAIVVYKDCANIDSENALKAFPMLLIDMVARN